MYHRQQDADKNQNQDSSSILNLINVTKNSLEPTGSVTFIVAQL
jgi:hypothetical protein